MFHDRSLLERFFRGFVLPALEYCSEVWSSAADTHLKLLHRADSGARFLTGGEFECDIAHHRSVAVLCMLCKIRCNPMHPLNDALPYVPCGLYAVPWSHISILMRHLTAEPGSTAGLLFSSQCPSGTILLTRIRWCWTGGFQEKGQCFFIGLSCSIPTTMFYYLSVSLLPVYRLVLWAGVFGLIHSLSAFHCRPLLIIIMLLQPPTKPITVP